jgi:hypothetical protein
MIAQGYEDGSWLIVALPGAICSQEATCARSRPVSLNEGVTLLAWARAGQAVPRRSSAVDRVDHREWMIAWAGMT